MCSTLLSGVSYLDSFCSGYTVVVCQYTLYTLSIILVPGGRRRSVVVATCLCPVLCRGPVKPLHFFSMIHTYACLFRTEPGSVLVDSNPRMNGDGALDFRFDSGALDLVEIQLVEIQVLDSRGMERRGQNVLLLREREPPVGSRT